MKNNKENYYGVENEYIARRLYINGTCCLIDFDDFLYLSNYWAEWFQDFGKWDRGEQNNRKFANCDKFVLQSLYEDRKSRTDILIQTELADNC